MSWTKFYDFNEVLEIKHFADKKGLARDDAERTASGSAEVPHAISRSASSRGAAGGTHVTRESSKSSELMSAMLRAAGSEFTPQSQRTQMPTNAQYPAQMMTPGGECCDEIGRDWFCREICCASRYGSFFKSLDHFIL